MPSLIRSGALGDQRDVWRALATRYHPVLLRRGGDDPIPSGAQLQALARLVRRARRHEIENAAHAFTSTDPARVARAPILIGIIDALQHRRSSWGITTHRTDIMALTDLLKEKLEKQLTSWDAELEAAQAKAKARQAEAEAEAADAELDEAIWSRVNELKDKLADGRRYLADLADAGEDKAEQVKAKVAALFD